MKNDKWRLERPLSFSRVPPTEISGSSCHASKNPLLEDRVTSTNRQTELRFVTPKILYLTVKYLWSHQSEVVSGGGV